MPKPKLSELEFQKVVILALEEILSNLAFNMNNEVLKALTGLRKELCRKEAVK